MDTIDRADDQFTRASRRQGPRTLRYALALVYLWFGLLKLRSRIDEAEELAGTTAHRLTMGRVSVRQGSAAIGLLECLIGLALLDRRLARVAYALIPPHLVGASSPLIVMPKRCFHRPWQPTIEGHYIIKNAVLAAAAFELTSRER